MVVTGWSPAGLDSRLTAMRAVLHQLADNPSLTAQAVIERFREPARRSQPSPRAGREDPRAGAKPAAPPGWPRARAFTRPVHPAVLPADAGIALRLRAAGVLEQAIDDLIDRHLRVAGHALALFCSLRQQMDDGRAQNTAIRRAGITFHLRRPRRPGLHAPHPRRAVAPQRRQCTFHAARQ